jgi:transposase
MLAYMIDEATLTTRIQGILPLLDERQRRLLLANEARSIGYGGVSAVSRASGVSRPTIIQGLKEIGAEGYRPSFSERCRKEGGGRKSTEEHRPDVVEKIRELVEPHTKGDPESPLLWTSKSTRNIEDELASEGITLSDTTVAKVLRNMGYSLQANKKDLSVTPACPDRDAQFGFINDTALAYMKDGLPVLSVDTKKKELIGNFKNGGREWGRKGTPTRVLDHDFPIKELGKATPYGVYDIFRNEGFVNVGISADTARFAAESIRRWWQAIGTVAYPGADSVYITADSGGSNGARVRLWKVALQDIADEAGLAVRVSHFPSGTSKWNTIEHRMFSFISQNWRGRPLVSLAVIVDLIGSTTTKSGLKVTCMTDENTYAKGIKVSDEELSKVNLVKDDFHGEWNYTILPH